VRGETDTSQVIGRISAAIGAALVDCDLLPDEILVDDVDRLANEALRHLVLDRRIAFGGRRTGREGQLDLFDDAIDQQLALGGAQLLGILLGVGESSQLVAELLLYRLLNGRQLLALENRVQAGAHLCAPHDVFLAGLHRQLRRQLDSDLFDERGRLARAELRDLRAKASSLRLLELAGQLEVEPLRLADATPQLFLCVTELSDLLVREREGLEDRLLGNLLGTCLDHRQRLLGADDEQIELRLLHLLHRGVDDQPVLDQADADGSNRAQEGQRGDHQRGRDAVDAKRVMGRDEVGGEHRSDALHLVAEALRPERPNRAVGHPGGQDRPFGRAPLALEKAAGDLAGGVHALLYVDCQREEVGALAGLRSPLCRREHHRLTRANHDCAVRLLG
jgi:hypothetical protein